MRKESRMGGGTGCRERKNKPESLTWIVYLGQARERQEIKSPTKPTEAQIRKEFGLADDVLINCCGEQHAKVLRELEKLDG